MPSTAVIDCEIRVVDTAEGATGSNIQGIGAGAAMIKTLDLIRSNGVVGLIGDTYSDPCKTAAVVAGKLQVRNVFFFQTLFQNSDCRFQIPQCSPSCYDPSLANKELYPYFFRTMASGLVQANAVGDLIEAMEWKRIVMMYTPDSMGSSGMHIKNTVKIDHELMRSIC